MMYDYKLHLVIRPHGIACGSSQRFALMDTMGDVIADIVGSGCGLLFIRILFHFKPSLASKLIRPYHEEIETEVVIPLKQPSEEHSQSKRN